MPDIAVNATATVLTVVFLAAMLWYSYHQFNRITEVRILGPELSGITSFSGKNSDFQAIDVFIKLLSLAEEKVEVFDDGNKMDGSIHESEEVIQVLEDKLAGNPQFQALYFFNDNENLRLTQHFDGEDRVKIHFARDYTRPTDQIHYKLIDGGRLAHLSTHGHGQEERNFEVLDCRNVPKEKMSRVAKVKFGTLRKRTYRHFPTFDRAAAASA